MTGEDLLAIDRSHHALLHAVARLEAWLETMRGPDGYGGPVAHWWQDALLYTGVGLDWRYEGIILGYLNLYRNTGDVRWLDKARRAGDDLVQGQLPSGNFRASCFEANPGTGGNPHEAACDLALIALAKELRDRGDSSWQVYAEAAWRNLQGYYLSVLWDEDGRLFRNSPADPKFVPNKAATAAEALLAWIDLSGEGALLERYVLPTLDAMLTAQVQAPGHPLDGAIDQAWTGRSGTGRFFPFYIARCIPALVQGYERSGTHAYLNGAISAALFLRRVRRPDGSFPQVVYRNGRVNLYPQWIAGVGDILRALDSLRRYGANSSPEPILAWLLRGQHPTGGIATARGLGSQASQRPPYRPDFRDLLPVCGWVDKAFRYLTGLVSRRDTLPEVGPFPAMEMECEFRGRRGLYRETLTTVELRVEGGGTYRWVKGSPWAAVSDGFLAGR